MFTNVNKSLNFIKDLANMTDDEFFNSWSEIDGVVGPILQGGQVVDSSLTLSSDSLCDYDSYEYDSEVLKSELLPLFSERVKKSVTEEPGNRVLAGRIRSRL